MAISFRFAFSLILSSTSFFVKFPMVTSLIFTSWSLGRIIAAEAGLIFSISLLISVIHFGSDIFPVLLSYSMRLCFFRSAMISSIGFNCISSFFASFLMS